MTWQYKLKSRVEGNHIVTDVFIGAENEYLSNIGTLKFAIPDDIGAWQLFGACLSIGANCTAACAHAEVILEGGDQVVQELPHN